MFSSVERLLHGQNLIKSLTDAILKTQEALKAVALRQVSILTAPKLQMPFFHVNPVRRWMMSDVFSHGVTQGADLENSRDLRDHSSTRICRAESSDNGRVWGDRHQGRRQGIWRLLDIAFFPSDDVVEHS